MIWPNFRTGAPVGIGRVATLWPIGTARATVTPSLSSTVPVGSETDRDDDVVVRMQPHEAARRRGMAAAACSPAGRSTFVWSGIGLGLSAEVSI